MKTLCMVAIVILAGVRLVGRAIRHAAIATQRNSNLGNSR
jgi:hypothetical protein